MVAGANRVGMGDCRALYMRGYMDAPEKRELGFSIAAASQILLLLLAIYGLAVTWMAVNAA